MTTNTTPADPVRESLRQILLGARAELEIAGMHSLVDAAERALAQGPQAAVGEREAFEAWARSNGFAATRTLPTDSAYSDSGSHMMWESWKARAAHATLAQQPAASAGQEPWPTEEQPDGTVTPVDPDDMRRLSPASAWQVPTGWKLVPEQATFEQIMAAAKAAKQYMDECGGNSPSVIYEAMLAAAPNPASQDAQAEPSDAQMLDWLERNLFEGKWGGVLGLARDWYMRGDYRHTLRLFKGDTLRDAIRAALKQQEQR